MKPTKDKYIRAIHAEKLLNVSHQVMARLLHSGKLRGIKIGGLWKVDMKEIERFKREGNAPIEIKVDFFNDKEEDE